MGHLKDITPYKAIYVGVTQVKIFFSVFVEPLGVKHLPCNVHGEKHQKYIFLLLLPYKIQYVYLIATIFLPPHKRHLLIVYINNHVSDGLQLMFCITEAWGSSLYLSHRSSYSVALEDVILHQNI